MKSANILILVLVTKHVTNLHSVAVLNLLTSGSTSTTSRISLSHNRYNDNNKG